MERLIWNVEDFLGREFRGSPVWGWLIVLGFAAIIIATLVAVAFGFEPPPRCNSNGDCWPEY